MKPSERNMQFFGSIRDMNFISEEKIGFPAVKSKIWPIILFEAKAKIPEEYDEDDNRESVLRRIDSLRTLGAARSSGGDAAVKFFRQVNEDIVRSEMSSALNELLPGTVNRLWSKRDFQGLVACYGRVFSSMHISESRLVNRMPVLFLAAFLQVASDDPACLSSSWWKDSSKCLKRLGVVVKKVCAEGFKKGEKPVLTHFAKLFVAGIYLLNSLIDDQYSFRDMSDVIEALEKADPTEYHVAASTLQEIEESLKIVHPTFHAEFSYQLHLHMEIAELRETRKGKQSKLKKYAFKENNKVLVSCYFPFVRDIAYMLGEIGNFVNEVQLNGYFQSVVKIFEKADEEETKESNQPTAHGRALFMAVPITFPNLIKSKFDKDACVRAIIERLPLPGGFGKPRKKKGRKRGRSPSPSQSEIEEIHRAVLGSDEEELEEEEIESGKAPA